MLYYQLSKKVDKPRGKSVALPVIEDRYGTFLTYHRALRKMLNAMAKHTREFIIPLVKQEKAAKRAEKSLLKDADEGWFTGLEALSRQLREVAGQTVRNILGLEAEAHTKKFMSRAKSAIGVDLKNLVEVEDLTGYLDAAAARNVALIKSLSVDAENRIRRKVIDATLEGRPIGELRRELTAEFKILDNRAKLIARDQMAKLNADLNRIRHEQAGVKKYKWITSSDERVRARHRGLHGVVYKYGESTGAEDGLPPGKPINCRCIAQGIVEF